MQRGPKGFKVVKVRLDDEIYDDLQKSAKSGDVGEKVVDIIDHYQWMMFDGEDRVGRKISDTELEHMRKKFRGLSLVCPGQISGVDCLSVALQEKLEKLSSEETIALWQKIRN